MVNDLNALDRGRDLAGGLAARRQRRAAEAAQAELIGDHRQAVRHRGQHLDADAAAGEQRQDRDAEPLLEDLAAIRVKAATYGQLNESANRLASYLITTNNIRPDDRIGVLLERGTGLFVALLGILKAMLMPRVKIRISKFSNLRWIMVPNLSSLIIFMTTVTSLISLTAVRLPGSTFRFCQGSCQFTASKCWKLIYPIWLSWIHEPYRFFVF